MKTQELRIGAMRLRPKTTLIIGEGGEATVYDVSLALGTPSALKLWKLPDHPDFAGNDELAKRNREAAAERLRLYAKKLRDFPTTLPARVVSPRELAFDGASQELRGYTMELLTNAALLRDFATKDYRNRHQIEPHQVVEIFRDLHESFSALHRMGVVWGDVNFNNILVTGSEARLIDADSIQFGDYLCYSFTPRFVDPKLCDPAKHSLVMVRPPNIKSDWYAFASMLFECLLFVHPYGGIYAPKRKSLVMPHDQRPLKGISVFHPEVVYPKRALPLNSLPAKVTGYFSELFESDLRGEFPLDLLELLTVHTRGYVDPAKYRLGPAVTQVIRGRVSVRKIFTAPGPILYCALQNGALSYIYHDGTSYRREHGSSVLNGPLWSKLRFRLCAGKTLVGKDGQMLVLGESQESMPVDSFRRQQLVFQSNGDHYYWLNSGRLYRDEIVGSMTRPKLLGNCLENQTRFWVGPKFGLGFYRAEGLQVGFVFDTERSGLNDSVLLPSFWGNLIGADCHFTEDRAWLFVSVSRSGSIHNLCVVLDSAGNVLAQAEGQEGDGSWLETISSKSAFTGRSAGNPIHALFAVTDSGLIALQQKGGSIELAARYPDTKDFVDQDDLLLYDSKVGLYLVRQREIQLLEIR